MSTVLWVVVIIVVAFAVGFGVGMGVGVYFGTKKPPVEPVPPEPNPTKKPWSELIKFQVVREELNVSDILEWINGFKTTLSSNDKIYLYKANKANVEKIGYEYIDKIDETTNIVGYVNNASNKSLSHIQLFTFGSASDQVIGLFNGFDYAVIEL